MAKQSPALRKAETKLASANARARKYKAEAEGIGSAAWRGFSVLAGAATAGAARAMMPDVMGIPTDAAGGLLVGGASLALGSPGGLMFACGWLAPYVADATEDAVGSAQAAAANAPMAAAI
jgi:hypothetical protein